MCLGMPGKHPGNTRETPGKHPGNTRETPRKGAFTNILHKRSRFRKKKNFFSHTHGDFEQRKREKVMLLGNTREMPGKHPGNTQEMPGKHQGKVHLLMF